MATLEQDLAEAKRLTTLQNTNSGTDTSGKAFTIPSAPVMTPESLGTPQPKVNIPAPSMPQQPTSFLQNLQPAVQQGQQGLIEAQTQEAKQRDDVLNRLLGVQDQDTQRIYDNRFNKLGGADFLKNFTDANTRLAQLQGVFNTAGQKISSAPGQSQVFEGLQLNEVSRQRAVEVGNQALVVQALQGNIETARQIALDTAKFASEDRAAKLQTLMAQFQSLDGIVQGQEKQLIDAAKSKSEKEYAQLQRVQATIDTAIQSGGASVEEMQQLTRTDLSDGEKMIIAQRIISKTAGADRQFQIDQASRSKYQLSNDAYGNPIVFNPATGAVSSINLDAITNTYQDGSQGGQCGTFAHKLCDFPSVGNTLNEKKASVDKNGISKAQWLQEGANPGDVIISSDNPTYGHVMVVLQDNGDGTVTVKDSNWGLDEKVQTRIVDKNDKDIYGVLRGTLKEQFTTPTQGQPLYSDVPVKLRPQVEKIANNWDNEPTVKGFNVVANTKIQTQAIDNNTNNPADDQALVYAFAKAMDPDSAVRDGEYATVQKYQQSIADQFKFNVNRIYSNATFLSPEARSNIKSAIDNKYQAYEQQYKNLYTDYGRRIDLITGRSNGTAYLQDYAQAVSQGTTTSPAALYAQQALGGVAQTTAPIIPYNQITNEQQYPTSQYGAIWQGSKQAYNYIKSLFN